MYAGTESMPKQRADESNLFHRLFLFTVLFDYDMKNWRFQGLKMLHMTM